MSNSKCQMNRPGPASLRRQAVEPVDNRFDCILAPADRKLVSSKVLKSDVSARLLVVREFTLPDPKAP